MTKILTLSASANRSQSKTNSLTQTFLDAFKQAATISQHLDRDVAQGLPFIDADWTGANFTPEEERTVEQKQKLALSDALIDEVEKSDLLLIALPIYNFSIPATMKAWIDMVARAQKTFVYSEAGPKGLLTGKKAVLFVASGGTKVDSAIDFAVPYMRHALAFIGITDVEVVAADALGADAEAFEAAENQARLLGAELATQRQQAA